MTIDWHTHLTSFRNMHAVFFIHEDVFKCSFFLTLVENNRVSKDAVIVDFKIDVKGPSNFTWTNGSGRFVCSKRICNVFFCLFLSDWNRNAVFVDMHREHVANFKNVNCNGMVMFLDENFEIECSVRIIVFSKRLSRQTLMYFVCQQMLERTEECRSVQKLKDDIIGSAREKWFFDASLTMENKRINFNSAILNCEFSFRFVSNSFNLRLRHVSWRCCGQRSNPRKTKGIDDGRIENSHCNDQHAHLHTIMSSILFLFNNH